MGSILEGCEERLKRYGMLQELPWGSALKALKSALRGKVVKHVFKPSGKYIYVVEGSTGPHLVLGRFGCSCIDFHLNVVVRGRRNVCYHMAAVLISKENDSFRVVRHRDPELIGFIKGVLSSEGLDTDP